MILLDLDSSDDRPIYGQIADRVRFAVAAGVLRPGELVPSVRELSKQLVVNPNTVARAYRDLQNDGLLEPVRGTGLQISAGAPERCREARREHVRRRLRGAIGEAVRSDLDRDEIEAILREEWANSAGAGSNGEGGRAMTETETRPAAITIDKLTKRYRDQTAVDGLSLVVPEGAVFGLLGENGAGKTTTLRTLLGLVAPTSGKVDVLGLDPVRQGLQVRRRVGYVPEVPALYDWMTVAEIGWFAAGFHPDPAGDTIPYQTRYRGLADGFGLPPDRKIKALSKGMRAKVSLALAVAGDPALLVLDEPTSGLDVLVRREFLESMVDLAGSGRTVLLSSHQIGEVERVASHVALLHKGKLLLAEPLDVLRARTFVVMLTCSGRDHPPAPPAPLGLDLIDADDAPRQAVWVVHADGRAACEAVGSLPGVESVTVTTPTLEEIYIAYMRSRRPRGAAMAAAVGVS